MLMNFWIVAWVGGGRRWPLAPTVARVAGFTGLGLAATLLKEEGGVPVHSRQAIIVVTGSHSLGGSAVVRRHASH
jgi:hypothetical protein